jgi:hypothetical protein
VLDEEVRAPLVAFVDVLLLVDVSWIVDENPENRWASRETQHNLIGQK